MASELSWRHTATGSTIYATIRSAARTYWNGSALEALTVGNWGNYDLALAETPASSYFYVGSWPAALSTVGWYWVDVYAQVGGTPAISDTFLGTLVVYWNGTAANPWAGDAVQVAGTAQTGGDLAGTIGTPVALDSGTATLAGMLTKLADDGNGATFDATTDSLQAIRDRGDAAWITATSVAVSDKTGFKLASDGLGSVTAWTVALTGNLSGSVGSVGTGGITSASFAAGAITAAVLATDCIDADAIASSAVSEIQSGLAVAGGTVTITSPVSADGETLTLVKGQDYALDDAWQIDFAMAYPSFPNLTGATVTLVFAPLGSNTAVLSVAGTVVSAGTASQKVRFQPTRTNMQTLTSENYNFWVWAVLSDTHQGRLVSGRATVSQKAS